jgi:hypothetical protein
MKGLGIQRVRRMNLEAHDQMMACASEVRNGIAWLSDDDYARIIGKLNESQLDADECAIVAEIDKSPEGLGDSLAALFAKIGADKAAKLFEKITGASCRCEQRRAWMNKWWPYKAA